MELEEKGIFQREGLDELLFVKGTVLRDSKDLN
jgi:hypothetical protein